MNNEIIVRDQSLFFDATKFEFAQRVSKMLSTATMVPEHFRNNLGNCVIALNYAHRMGIDPFMAMQKMYVIHGKPALETQLQIALFNQGGRFSALKYKMSGSGDAQQCVAYATDLATKEVIEGPPVSIAMAKSEGWYSKSGSKWKTLPELMLRYRAAAFFIRLYAPETTMGLHTPEELYDSGEVIDVTPVQDAQQEIDTRANQEPIDITPDPAPMDEPEPGPEPEPEPDGSQGEDKQAGPDF
ncbi:MAG: hypothetical protein PHG14_06665 [Desulfobacter postgatei]|uniref:hypothetical protein n=1 Tax=Desulfobacter postgatei TaxID=2293 RepID=UPI0023F112C1|nr:hypothetical protein [Desulfobacter postgatei]MDD4273393.1 hypothetical protein [Desulfobacter postgatei]